MHVAARYALTQFKIASQTRISTLLPVPGKTWLFFFFHSLNNDLFKAINFLSICYAQIVAENHDSRCRENNSSTQSKLFTFIGFLKTLCSLLLWISKSNTFKFRLGFLFWNPIIVDFGYEMKKGKTNLSGPNQKCCGNIIEEVWRKQPVFQFRWVYQQIGTLLRFWWTSSVQAKCHSERVAAVCSPHFMNFSKTHFEELTCWFFSS